MRNKEIFQGIAAAVILLLVSQAVILGAYLFSVPNASSIENGGELCPTDADVVLVMDVSGSMNEKEAIDEPRKIDLAKEAAKSFVDNLQDNDQSALVSFSTEAKLEKQLSNDHLTAKEAIDDLRPLGATNIGAAIAAGIEELSSDRVNSEATKTMILLTDGKATLPGDGFNEGPEAIAYATSTAKLAADLGFKIFTIGLGSDSEINEEMLLEIATSTGAQYYHAPNGNGLSAIYNQIAYEICQIEEPEPDPEPEPEEPTPSPSSTPPILPPTPTPTSTPTSTLPIIPPDTTPTSTPSSTPIITPTSTPPTTEESISSGGGGGGGPIGLRIFNEENLNVSTASATISWFTNKPAVSRVLYDTVSHSISLGPAPNYGYASSSLESLDTATFHEITLSDLTASTTYFWRPIASASSEIWGKELSFITEAIITTTTATTTIVTATTTPDISNIAAATTTEIATATAPAVSLIKEVKEEIIPVKEEIVEEKIPEEIPEEIVISPEQEQTAAIGFLTANGLIVFLILVFSALIILFLIRKRRTSAV